jgi:hypothetical protein
VNDATKVDAEQSDNRKKQTVISSGAVKFIIGCTESEEEAFNSEINRLNGSCYRNDWSVDTTRAAIQRDTMIDSSNDRKRMQSECSSGVSTRFSCSESNNVSSRSSIASSLSSDSELDGVSDRKSFSHDSLLGGKRHLKKMASMEIATFASTTNEGFVVSVPPPLTKKLVVNPVPSVEIIWSYEIVDGMLVASAPSSIHKTRGINDALVTLLEYGENDLHCSRAVILVERDSAEKDSMLRMFSFLGFTQLERRATPPSLRPYITQYILMVTDFSDLQDNDSDFDFED